MSTTPILGLPLMSAGQAQKEITYNLAQIKLELFANRRILDKDLTAPPPSPAESDAYIIASSATGTWTGKDGQIAHFIGGEWLYYAPIKGLPWYVDDEDKYYAYRGVIPTWQLLTL